MSTKATPKLEQESSKLDYFDYYGETREERSAPRRTSCQPWAAWTPTILDDWPEDVPVFVEELELYELYFADELDQILGIRE